MTDGMRRPPRLWEQKLEGKIRASGLGAGSVSGGTSPIVGAPAPGPGGPGESIEAPPVVDPDPSTPRVPATPSVFAAIGGIAVIWTGLDDDGDPFPAGTTVQVHVSDSSGFTPDASTLRGVLRSTERLVVTGLTSGTTYYVVFVLVFPDGTEGEPSAEQSSSAGFVLSTNIGTGEITADLVSFNAAAIGGIQQFVGTTTPPTTGAEGSTWINTTEGSYYTLTGGSWVKRQWDSGAIAANAISTVQLAAGAITAGSGIIGSLAVGDAQIADLSASKLTAGTIDANVITVNNLDADNITTGTLTGRTISGGTITGATVQTSAGSQRIVLASDELQFFGSGVKQFDVTTAFNTGLGAWVASFSGGLDIGSGGLDVAGAAVDMPGVYNNNTTGIDSVGITAAARLRRISSTQAIKYDMAALSATLSDSVDADRQLGVATVDPDDVLDLAVTEFSVIDDDEPTERRVLGFIADDVADKLPIAATYDADGTPAGVLDTAILASLLAVVQSQQQTIADLTARIEALEA
ncbi:MAG TPA: hypothetical protein VIG24_03670 [Acidimicrobiia bacterium]